MERAIDACELQRGYVNESTNSNDIEQNDLTSPRSQRPRAIVAPPHRFGFVTPSTNSSTTSNGISRGSYPILPFFRFLRRLRLKTIVSLVPEEPTQDLKDFCELYGIRLVHIQVSSTSQHFYFPPGH